MPPGCLRANGSAMTWIKRAPAVASRDPKGTARRPPRLRGRVGVGAEGRRDPDGGALGWKGQPARRGPRVRSIGIPLMQLHRLHRLLPPANPKVDHLDEDRERHRGVDVALGDVQAEPVGHQHQADHDQEAQRQHLDGRMALDELADRPGEHQHEHDRDQDRGDHHPALVDHADCGDDRVEREHDVEHHDLHDDAAEGRRHRAGGDRLGRALELLVDLVRGLADQEQAAADQDQVAPGEVLSKHREQRRGQPDDPGDGHQQPDPRTAASVMPRRRALSRCAGGSFPARIEMKMMLSMPSTSSSAVRVASAIQVSGFKRTSTVCALRKGTE